MKYVLALTATCLCLGGFVLALQGDATEGKVGLGSLLKEEPVKAVPAGQEAKPADVDIDQKESVEFTEKRPKTRNEAIRQALKGRTWEEAKPDVIRILNEYSIGKKEKRKDSYNKEQSEYWKPNSDRKDEDWEDEDSDD